MDTNAATGQSGLGLLVHLLVHDGPSSVDSVRALTFYPIELRADHTAANCHPDIASLRNGRSTWKRVRVLFSDVNNPSTWLVNACVSPLHTRASLIFESHVPQQTRLRAHLVSQPGKDTLGVGYQYWLLFEATTLIPGLSGDAQPQSRYLLPVKSDKLFGGRLAQIMQQPARDTSFGAAYDVTCLCLGMPSHWIDGIWPHHGGSEASTAQRSAASAAALSPAIYSGRPSAPPASQAAVATVHHAELIHQGDHLRFKTYDYAEAGVQLSIADFDRLATPSLQQVMQLHSLVISNTDRDADWHRITYRVDQHNKFVSLDVDHSHLQSAFGFSQQVVPGRFATAQQADGSWLCHYSFVRPAPTTNRAQIPGPY